MEIKTAEEMNTINHIADLSNSPRPYSKQDFEMAEMARQQRELKAEIAVLKEENERLREENIQLMGECKAMDLSTRSF